MGAPLRFIHCADLHLGSRFVGVTSQDEGLGRRLSTATFDALENLVEAANREAVDFVLFSGDVFDSSNETPYARSRFADAVSRINDPEQKMSAAAEGLDRIKGEFTLDDIERIIPGQGRRFAEAMLESCLIHEVSYGRYRI